LGVLTAAALALLLPAEEPQYPLGGLRFPSLTAPGPPLVLSDLRYRVSQDSRTVQSLELRVRLGRFAFLGGEVSGERRGVFFDTQRLSLGLSEEEGGYELEAGYRASRFLLRARGEKGTPAAGEGWVVDALTALRLSPDLEVVVSWLEDTEPGASLVPLSTRVIREGSAGLLYQRGTRLDLAATAARSTVRTAAGFELSRSAVRGGATLLASPVELSGEAGYARTGGRLPQQEGLARLGGLVQLGDHLVSHAEASGRWEPGVKLFEHQTSVGLTFYGRRYRFPRGGEAAERTLGLARRAQALGYNERRSHDLDGRRALRERLALSPAREQLADDIDALYRAQVAERNVAQAGFEVLFDSDDVAGRSGRAFHAFLALPWPPAWPFTRREQSVEFLRVDFFRREDRFAGPELVSKEQQVRFELALNREMSLVFVVEEPGRLPFEVATLTGRPRRYELEYVYAFGR
jgi:hypothetical protein